VSVAAAMTAERVWKRLAEIPDPEIPVVSLVDLGVVRDVAVDGERVRVEFTPTFLGCPALELMRGLMADAVRELGGEPEVAVVTARGPGEAPRGGVRAAGTAPGRPDPARRHPAGRVPLPLLRVDRDEAREHVRPDAVPLDSLLRELPAAVRAVQDGLNSTSRRLRATPLERRRARYCISDASSRPACEHA
jgi:metal-sulfur cluster biosynthetic enzyme